jgi:hypothetical protein
MSKVYSAGIGAAIGGGLLYALARLAEKRQAQCLLSYAPSGDPEVQVLSKCDAKDPIAIFAPRTGVPWWVTMGFGMLVGGVSGYAAGKSDKT